MTDFLDWIYKVFSSSAAIGEISFIGIIAAFLTYFADRRKRNEVRNATLLDLRKRASERIRENLDAEIKKLSWRAVASLDEEKEYREGRFYEAKVGKIPTESDLRKSLHVEGASQPVSYLLGNTAALIHVEYEMMEALSKMFEPDAKEVTLWSGLTVSVDPKMVSKIREALTDVHINLGKHIKLIYKQLHRELSVLQPSEPFSSQIRTRVSIYRHQRYIKKMWKAFKEKKN